MFAYCNNLPVNYKDPYGQGLEIIPLFFFYDGDEESSKENPEDISGKFIGQRLYITLSKSEAFREFLRQHIPAKSDCVNHSYTYPQKTFSGSSKDSLNDIGLALSIGEVTVELQYTYYEGTDGSTVWEVQFIMQDGYTFEHWGDDAKVGGIVRICNNYGYDLQQRNIIPPYHWKLSGSMYFFSQGNTRRNNQHTKGYSNCLK